MLNLRKGICFLILNIFANLAQAASTAGNGGYLIRCVPDPEGKNPFDGLYALDYIDMYNQENKNAHVVPVISFDQSSMRIRTNLSRMAPEMVPDYDKFAKSVQNLIKKSKDETAERQWAAASWGVIDYDDQRLSRDVAENCKIFDKNSHKKRPNWIPFVRRKERLKHKGLARHISYDYNRDVFAEIFSRPEQFSWAIHHEWGWDFTHDPSTIRDLNLKIHSDELENPESNAELFRKTLTRWGILRTLDADGMPSHLTQEQRDSGLLKDAIDGNYDYVLNWIESDANVDARDPAHRTALMWAAINNHPDVAQALIDNEAAVNPMDDTGHAALFYAAAAGAKEIVQMLIAANAEIDARAKNSGRTALAKALLNRHPDVAQYLIEAGADVNLPTAPSSREEYPGWTPFQIAARNGLANLMPLMMQKGGRREQKVSNTATLPVSLLDKATRKNAVNFNFDILALAAMSKSAETLNAVIQNGADLHTKSANTLHWNLLMCAAMADSAITIKTLVEDHQLDVNQSDDYGNTALHIAAALDQVDALAQLLREKADYRLRNSAGLSPWDVAKNENKKESLKYLKWQMEGRPSEDVPGVGTTDAVLVGDPCAWFDGRAHAIAKANTEALEACKNLKYLRCHINTARDPVVDVVADGASRNLCRATVWAQGTSFPPP